MSRFVRPMELGDVAQAADIERESFPPPWPATNFKHDLKSNTLTSYLVACDGEPVSKGTISDDTGLPSGPGGPEAGSRAVRSRWRRLFGIGGRSSTPERLILGFLGLWFMVDEAHISNVAVRLCHRGMGIGEHLVLAGLELAIQRECEFVTLEVRVSNSAARRLYEKCGFVEVGLRPRYYTDNKEDAVLMTAEGIKTDGFREGLERLKQAHAGRWGPIL